MKMIRLSYAIKVLSKRYSSLVSAGDSESLLEAEALRTVVAQAIINDELGMETDKELRHRTKQHLYLYPKEDRIEKERRNSQIEQNKRIEKNTKEGQTAPKKKPKKKPVNTMGRTT